MRMLYVGDIMGEAGMHVVQHVLPNLRRERQIDLVIEIGDALQRLVRRRWIGVALRAAHGPARAAGFGVLQDFLELGYRAFTGMEDARTLLVTIRQRELRLMETLYSNRDDPFGLCEAFRVRSDA